MEQPPGFAVIKTPAGSSPPSELIPILSTFWVGINTSSSMLYGASGPRSECLAILQYVSLDENVSHSYVSQQQSFALKMFRGRIITKNLTFYFFYNLNSRARKPDPTTTPCPLLLQLVCLRCQCERQSSR
jgi:hypothetical protein